MQTHAHTTADREVRQISLDGLLGKMARNGDLIVVMAMDRRRFDVAHIEGSIDFDTMLEMAPSLAVDREIVVYCTDSACAASRIRAAQLAEAGFSDVSRFAGGLAEWAAAGLPVATAVPASA